MHSFYSSDALQGGSKCSRLPESERRAGHPEIHVQVKHRKNSALGKGTETVPHTRAFPAHASRGAAGTPPAPHSSVNGLRRRRALRPTLRGRFQVHGAPAVSRALCSLERHQEQTRARASRNAPSGGTDRAPQNKIQVKLSVSGGGDCCEKYRREGRRE